MRQTFGLAIMILAVAALGAGESQQRAFRFSKDEVGKLPVGWKAERTGKGEGSVWKIVEDDTSPSKTGYVLAQTSESPKSIFNICVAEGTSYKDVELSVSFKPIAGKNDQGGGFVWRYQDHNNYYVARANPAGKTSTSFAVYKVVEGKRTALQSKSAKKIPIGEWHKLRITMTGDHIECYLDGEKLLDAKDATFPIAGKVGLWSKSDARTHFDEFTVTDIGAENRQPLKRIAVIELKGTAGALDHLGADWKHSRLFLANQSNNTLDVVDVKSNKLVTQVAGQKQIHGIAHAPELDRIFVGNGDGVCNVLDGRDYTVLKSIPVKNADSVRYDPRTNHVFVASDKALAVIDAKTLELLTTIKLPASSHGFQVAVGNPRVYVNNGLPCQVAVVDSDKNEIVARYALEADKGIGPLALDEANQRIFVGLRRNPRLAVLEMDSGKECASIPIPEGSDDMFVDAKAKRIYISCNSGFVAVIRQIDADRYETLANVPTIKGAKTCAYDPATQRLYLAVPRQAGKEGPEIWVYQGPH